jgi:hypothetical protein
LRSSSLLPPAKSSFIPIAAGGPPGVDPENNLPPWEHGRAHRVGLGIDGSGTATPDQDQRLPSTVTASAGVHSRARSGHSCKHAAPDGIATRSVSTSGRAPVAELQVRRGDSGVRYRRDLETPCRSDPLGSRPLAPREPVRVA